MNVPRHIAVIMDGNRRFSRRLMAKPWKGHEWGAEKVEEFLQWSQEAGVSEVTLYALSVQNFERPKEEFEQLLRIFRETFKKLKERAEVKEKHALDTARIRFIGRRSLFPQDLQDSMRALEEKTADHTGLRVNIAMGYGGREEVIDAVREIAHAAKSGKLSPEEVTEDAFAEFLYMQSEPDLVIRTGGERRTSNFLLWQSHYAEWVFLEKCWPELEQEDFVEALHSYDGRERRFGA